MIRSLFAVGLVALLAAPGLAQEDRAEPDPPRRAEVVDVEADLPAVPVLSATTLKSPLPLQLTPASVSIVSRPVFQAQAALVASDALGHAAGVFPASGFGVFDFFTLRGFDSLSSGLVLTDAVAEPESTFFPLYNVRQVEVLKGPGAFLYGGNALAGAVHLVRKQPRPGRFADLNLLYGRFDTVEGTLDGNVANEDGSLAFRLNALTRGSDGYRDGMESAQHAIHPAVSWRPDASTRLAFSLEYVRSEFQPDSGLPLFGGALPDVPRTRSFQSPFDHSGQDLYRVRLDAERQLGEHVLLRDKLYYTELDWRSDGTLLSGAFPDPRGGALVARGMTLLDDRQRILGNQLEAVVSFATGPARHRLLAGVELVRALDDFTLDVAALPFIGLYEPVETAQRPLFILPGFSQAGNARATTVAPYVVDEIALSDKLRLLAGARLDAIDYEEKVSGTRRDDTQVSPLGGLVFSPTGRLSFYASAGRAFGPPSTLVVGERRPERSYQVEVGAKRTFLGHRGLATFALYHLEKEDIAIPDSTGVTRQAGDQRSRGAELEVSAEVARGWFAFGSYAYTDAELTRFAEVVPLAPPDFVVLDRSGNRPPFAPRHLASLWAMKEFDLGFGLGLGARYVGRHFVAEDNGYEVDPYLTLDVAASYRRGRMKMSLHCKNVTDAEYETRGFGGAAVTPGRPFTAYARVELSLGSR
ncbi:MAG TPA: TonB-dependent siderophore receptor [Vicinamibacteria bacterium]|nr:TonB-dependent siderophore receptor [Vicinamibacteria bacterium]